MQILACILRKTEHSLTSEQIVSVAATAHGFVGADLKELCTQGERAGSDYVGHSRKYDFYVCGVKYKQVPCVCSLLQDSEESLEHWWEKHTCDVRRCPANSEVSQAECHERSGSGDSSGMCALPAAKMVPVTFDIP